MLLPKLRQGNYACLIIIFSLIAVNNRVYGQIADGCIVQTAKEIAAQFNNATAQNFWVKASQELKIKLAEHAGEVGARTYATNMGWTAIDDGLSRGMRQGADQVYFSADKTVHVIEAKGGYGRLGNGYGHPQGSAEWAVEAANETLRRGRLASEAQTRGAAYILQGAKNGKLEIHVVKTLHHFGKPSETIVVQTTKCTQSASQIASNYIDDVFKSIAQQSKPIVQASSKIVKATAGASNAANNSGSLGKAAAKSAVPVAVALDSSIRIMNGIDTEKRFAEGAITVQQREVEHTRNATGMAGGWAGGWSGAKIGAWGGGAAGTAACPGVGTTVGGILGGVAGGVGGYLGGEAVAAEAGEWVVTQVHAAGTTIGECTEVAWDGTVYAAGKVSDGAVYVWDGTVNAASSVSDGIVSAWDWAWGN